MFFSANKVCRLWNIPKAIGGFYSLRALRSQMAAINNLVLFPVLNKKTLKTCEKRLAAAFIQ